MQTTSHKSGHRRAFAAPTPDRGAGTSEDTIAYGHAQFEKWFMDWCRRHTKPQSEHNYTHGQAVAAAWEAGRNSQADRGEGVALNAAKLHEIFSEVNAREPLGKSDEFWEEFADALTAAPQPKEAELRTLTFTDFSRINRQRCEAKDGFNHQLNSWSTSDWFLALLGELGEAANIAKKLNRVRDGIPGNKLSKEELETKLRQELGDSYVYLDLLAQSVGVSIGEAAVEVFNAKSDELGCHIRAALATRPAQGEKK